MGLPEKLKELRWKHGISQKKLADAIDVSQSSINFWEKGERTPSIDAVIRLANYFDVPVENLADIKPKKSLDERIQEAEEQKKEQTKATYYLNDETAKVAQEMFENEELKVLFDAARDADPEDLKLVRNMLLALKRKEQGDDD